MPIRTLIVDDEPLARLNLSTLLAEEPDFQVIGECADVDAARRAVAATAPQLLFLDVQMPGADGFELLDGLTQVPAVVFVTAHEEFALRAFEACALDYLLKPFRRDRFARTLQRVRERVATLPPTPGPERLLVRTQGRYTFVALAEITHIRADANYVTLHGAQATHRVRETMNDLERRLPGHQFARIHRSVIVNLTALRELELLGDGEYLARLGDGRGLPVGPNYAQALKARLSGTLTVGGVRG